MRCLCTGIVVLGISALPLFATQIAIPPVSPSYRSEAGIMTQGKNDYARWADPDEQEALGIHSQWPTVLAQGSLLLWGQKDSYLADTHALWVSGDRVPHWQVYLYSFPYGTPVDNEPAQKTLLLEADGSRFSLSLWLDQLLASNQYGLVEVYLRQTVEDYIFAIDPEQSSRFNPDPNQYVLYHRFFMVRRGALAVDVQLFPHHLYLSTSQAPAPVHFTAVAYEPESRESIAYVPLQLQLSDHSAQKAFTNARGEAYGELLVNTADFSVRRNAFLPPPSADPELLRVPLRISGHGLSAEIEQEILWQVWVLPDPWVPLSRYGTQIAAPRYPVPLQANLNLRVGTETHIQDEKVLWAQHELFSASNPVDAVQYQTEPGRLVVVKVAEPGATASKRAELELGVRLSAADGRALTAAPIITGGWAYYVPADQSYELQVQASDPAVVFVSEHLGERSRWLGRHLFKPGQSQTWDFGP